MSFEQNHRSNHDTKPKKEQKSDFSESDFTIFGEKFKYWRSLCHRPREKIEDSESKHSNSDMSFIEGKGPCPAGLSSSCQNRFAIK